MLDAAKREGSDRTVLMYASDRAMNALPDPLPRQLEVGELARVGDKCLLACLVVRASG